MKVQAQTSRSLVPLVGNPESGLYKSYGEQSPNNEVMKRLW